jgi:succinate dehydrogenase/fumarate reductase-like Fe-S protein
LSCRLSKFCGSNAFIADSRDEATGERLDNLEDPYRLFRYTIMNCVDVPQSVCVPTCYDGKIKEMMVLRRFDPSEQICGNH